MGARGALGMEGRDVWRELVSLSRNSSDPLRVLRQRIERAHKRIIADRNDVVSSAVECGQWLTEARELVDTEWVAWMRENLTVHPTTAYVYMRLYRHREQIADQPTIDAAVRLLSTASLSPEAIAEIRRLYDNGHGLKQTALAEMFGVRKSTINYHVHAESRNRVKTVQRATRYRATQALQREQQHQTIKTAGGPLSVAYGHVRKALEALQRADGEEQSYERRRYVQEAIARAYEVEDAIVAANKTGGEASRKRRAVARPTLVVSHEAEESRS